MPIYAYHCPACGHRWEALSRRPHASDEDETTCLRCGERARRVPSASAVRVEGDSAANSYGLRRMP